MSNPSQADLTHLLRRWNAGDDDAERDLLPLVYDELKRIAGAALGPAEIGSIDATEVVHEAYLRLLKSDAEWNDRVHFFAFSARLIRNILVDFARRRLSAKRGGRFLRVTFDRLHDIEGKADPSVQLLALHEAMERLALISPRAARVVELHYFGGMDYEQTAAALKISKTTVSRDLKIAKIWLRKEMRQQATEHGA